MHGPPFLSKSTSRCSRREVYAKSTRNSRLHPAESCYSVGLSDPLVEASPLPVDATGVRPFHTQQLHSTEYAVHLRNTKHIQPLQSQSVVCYSAGLKSSHINMRLTSFIFASIQAHPRSLSTPPWMVGSDPSPIQGCWFSLMICVWLD